MIQDIVSTLVTEFKCNFVGTVQEYSEGGDIDFIALPGRRTKIVFFLQSKGFLVRENPGRGILAYIFFEGGLYVIDVADSPNQSLLLCFNKDVQFNKNFIYAIYEDSKLEKFMRYVLQFRNKKQKFLDFIYENHIKYGKYLYDTTYISKPIFKSTVSARELVVSMDRSFFSMIKVIPVKRVLRIKFEMFKLHLNRFGKGKIIAFVGADGAGKTTAINSVWEVVGAHIVYMGDVNFKLQKFYNWLLNRNIYIARTVYIFMFFENWLRYLWLISRKIKGDIILTDRWPGLNQHLKKQNKKMYFHDLLYKLFPDADLYIFLSGDPVEINCRKNELTIVEINDLQTNLRKRLLRKNFFEISNSNLDKALILVLNKLLLIHWSHTIYDTNS